MDRMCRMGEMAAPSRSCRAEAAPRCPRPSIAATPVTCHSSPVTRRSGFTLVELLTVLTILVLLSALAAPAFTRQYHTAQLNSAARNIVALIQYARSQAVVEGTTYRLNIDQQTGRLWVTHYDDGTQTEQEPNFVIDESALGSERLIPEGVLVREIALGDEALAQLSDEALQIIQAQQGQLNEEGTPYITFSPQGTTDGARILLENDYEDRVAISLDAVTGRTEIAEVTENP
jgi:type II secretion system protein H